MNVSVKTVLILAYKLSSRVKNYLDRHYYRKTIFLVKLFCIVYDSIFSTSNYSVEIQNNNRRVRIIPQVKIGRKGNILF